MTREELSQFLLALYRGSKERPIQSFRQWSLARLAQIIPFDWVSWRCGTVEGDFCQLYFSACYQTSRLQNVVLEPGDNLPLISRITDPAQTLSMATSVLPATEYREPPPTSIHEIDTGKPPAITATSSHPVLFTAICLYRNDPKAGFTEQEQKAAMAISPHLVESWLIKLFVHLQNTQSPFKSMGETALCDSQGTLWCAHPQFAELLREEWPQWRGHILPKELSKIIHSGGTHIVHDGKYLHCTTSAGPTSDLFYVHIQKQPPLLSLPPRQRRIAIELAQGKTYNQIAHNLGISRSTVTNHANAIYSKLGISNKVQLAILCFGHTLQSLIM